MRNKLLQQIQEFLRYNQTNGDDFIEEHLRNILSNYEVELFGNCPSIPLEKLSEDPAGQPEFPYADFKWDDLSLSFNQGAGRCEFKYGEFNLLFSKIAVGKTQLLSEMALIVSEHIPVMFVSWSYLEDVLLRFYSIEGGVPSYDLAKEFSGEYHEINVSKISAMMRSKKMYLITELKLNLSALLEEAKRNVLNHGVKLIIIDQLDRLVQRGVLENTQEDNAFISLALNRFARKHNVIIVASCSVPTESYVKEYEYNYCDEITLQRNFAFIGYADNVMMLNGRGPYDYYYYHYGASDNEGGETLVCQFTSTRKQYGQTVFIPYHKTHGYNIFDPTVSVIQKKIDPISPCDIPF
jgi:hypothetical protein